MAVAVLLTAPMVAQEDARRLAVWELAFEGNRAIDDFTLSISIVTSQSAWFARAWPFRLLGLGQRRFFNETEFRRDVLRILLLYRQSGYLDARIDTIVTRRSDHVNVRFLITEGEPVRIESLTVTGMEHIIPTERLLRDLPLRVGDAFDRPRFLIISTDSIRSMLQNRGYPYPEVYRSFTVQNVRRSAQLGFIVEPGPAAVVDSVEVIGPPDLDQGLVRKVLRIQPGSPFSQQALYEGQRQLYRLGVFDFVDVRLADTVPGAVSDSVVRVRVQVSESRLHRIRLGAGYGTADCFRTLSSWTAQNFLGGARTLELSAAFSKIGVGAPLYAGLEDNICRALRADRGTDRLDLNYNLTASLRFPTVFSPRRSATIALSAERFSEFQAYVRDAIGGNVSITQRTKWNIPVSLSYSLSYGKTVADDAVFCSILNVCRAEDAAIFREKRVKAIVGMDLLRDRTNSSIGPTRGTVLSLGAGLAVEEIGSDPEIEFAKGVIELASFHPVGRRSVFAWRVRAGTLRSPDITFQPQEVKFIPTEERFYGGGPNTVRGFRQNGIGPLVYVEETVDVFREVDSLPGTFAVDTTVVDTLVSPTGGTQMLFLNAEYRFPLSLSGRIGGVVFIDVGQVSDPRGQPKDTGIRITPGVGFRVFTPLGPIRLDLAYNPHGPEEGPLFARKCTDRPDQRMCEDAILLDDAFVPVLGDGLFGLGKHLPFLKQVRVNFSIGQAF